MRRLLLVLAVAAVMAAMLISSALPAFADAGGVPNDNSCHGQTISTDAQNGFPPGQIQKNFDVPVKEFQQDVREFCS